MVPVVGIYIEMSFVLISQLLKIAFDSRHNFVNSAFLMHSRNKMKCF